MKILNEIIIAVITVIKSVKIKSIVDKVTEIVVSAVKATNQTYTDSLKESGGFTKDAQLTAYNKTYSTVKALITEEVAELIESEYGDFEVYINTFIEKTVKEMKNA